MAQHTPGSWQVISSEYLFKNPWLTVRREAVALPSGHIIPSYFVLEYPRWVNVIALTTDGQFVMVRQYRHGIGRTSYELCAGVCDPGDLTPLDAAKRELLEETGYGHGHWQEWMVVAPNPATQNNFTYTFLATGVEPVSGQHLEPSEDLSVHLLSLEAVRSLLEAGEILQALHAAPLWKYMACRQASYNC